MFTAARIKRFIQSRGQTVTLRRLGNSPPDDVSCVAHISEKDDVGVGNVVQFRRQITISNAEIVAASWPGPPRKGDQVIADGKVMTVQAVLVQKVRDVTVMHRLEILGG